MKPLLLFLSCATLTSCGIVGSKTAFYYRDGKTAFVTNADATGLKVSVTGVGSLSAVTHIHSTSIAAKGDSYSKIITSAGNAVGQGAKAFATP